MRKKLYHFYNLISSYPVLILMIVGLGVLLYLGSEYKPLELEQARKLDVQIKLQQEQKAIRDKLLDIGISDTIKRYLLFNRDFLTLSNIEEGELSEQMASVLRSYGWIQDSLDHSFPDDSASRGNTHNTNKGAKIDGAIIKIEASSFQNMHSTSEPFLPFYSGFQVLKYMWMRPPFKEYQRIKLSRTKEGYRLDFSLFMPLQDTESSIDLEEDLAI